MSEPMMDGPRMRIVIVDDDFLVRAMLRQILSAERDFEVVGEAESGEKALEAIRVLHLNALIVDDQKTDDEGVNALRQVATEFPSVHVAPVALAELRKVAPEMVESGARLSVEQKCPPVDRLLAELRTLLERS